MTGDREAATILAIRLGFAPYRMERVTNVYPVRAWYIKGRTDSVLATVTEVNLNFKVEVDGQQFVDTRDRWWSTLQEAATAWCRSK